MVCSLVVEVGKESSKQEKLVDRVNCQVMYEIRKKGWDLRSMAQYSASVREALGSVPSTSSKTLEQHYYEEEINHGDYV